MFLTLFGRPPFPAEREMWQGEERGKLLDELLGSEEFWWHWYEEQLYFYLLIDNFRPATDTLLAVAPKLAEGRLSVRDAVHRIALSPTFDMRNPGADTFVTVVMEQIAGMKVQANKRELEIGKALYDGGQGQFLGRKGSGQSDVVQIAVNSKQASRALITREFERLMNAEMDRKQMLREAREFGKDPYLFIELLRGWFDSEAYDARLAKQITVPNRIFVRALFVDLFNRLPTDEEALPMRNALDGLSDSRPLRSVLVRLLLDSGRVPMPTDDQLRDATTWVAGLFRRLLGREATRNELAVFVRSLEGPNCDPKTVLYALLSCAEYHRF
ncbi:MAG: hypothetical protein ACI835_003436 [Planctomycetota bacterium]